MEEKDAVKRLPEKAERELGKAIRESAELRKKVGELEEKKSTMSSTAFFERESEDGRKKRGERKREAEERRGTKERGRREERDFRREGESRAAAQPRK